MPSWTSTGHNHLPINMIKHKTVNEKRLKKKSLSVIKETGNLEF
jgi:hypothetical protein